MTVLVETRHPGEFILSEANGQRSRETITIASGAGVIAASPDRYSFWFRKYCIEHWSRLRLD